MSNTLQSLASWRRSSTALNMVTKPVQLEADASFEDVVLKSELPVLVDFHARYVKHTVVAITISPVDGLGSSLFREFWLGGVVIFWGCSHDHADFWGWGVDHMQNHIEVKLPSFVLLIV